MPPVIPTVGPEFNSSTYELRVVHPAVAQWLTENGYEYRHEVKMPYYGKADFVATKDGKTLIVECKPTAEQCGHAIMQVKDYRDQWNKKATVMVAFPSYTITDRTRLVCQKRNVLLLDIDVNPIAPKPIDPQVAEEHRKLMDAVKLVSIKWEHDTNQPGASGVPEEDRARFRTWTAEQVYDLMEWAANYARTPGKR